MKLLILLALTWKFSFSVNLIEFCNFGDDGDELLLDCNAENVERIHSIKNESVSCGHKVVQRGSIKYVKIEGCEEIESETFSEMNLPNLREVKLFRSNLTNIGAAFDGSHQLRRLEIIDDSYSSISLPSRLFRDMTQLGVLLLRCNEISNWGTIDFKGLEKLKILFINTDEISYVNENWNIPKSLKYLFLSNNHVRDINSMIFPQLPNLIHLLVNVKRIEQVDSSTFNGLVNLRTLILGRNAISRIENGAFLNLNALKKLDLSYNRLTALDEHTFNGLSGLQYLSLRGNRISAMSLNTFSALTNLIQLDLSAQDGLVTIDLNAFPQFIDLQTMTVLYTALSLVPDDLEQKEMQWLQESFELSDKSAPTKNTIYLEAFGHFTLNQTLDHQIDLRNLTHHIEGQSLILGNLDLSDNQIISIHVEKRH